MKIRAVTGAVVVALAGCAAGPSQAPAGPAGPVAQTVCRYPAFVEQRPYYSGAVVTHGGKLYRAKHDNPGYIPSVSTYFWSEVTPFVTHRRYYEEDVVSFEGRVYLAEHDNPAYMPNISTYYWAAQNCPQ